MEFFIRRTDGEWFDLPWQRRTEILHPNSFASRSIPGWGNHRIEVLGCEVSFSDEDPGIQVCFETGDISAETAEQIVTEICENIERATGQKAKVIPLG